ncbi:hypothetical protein BpHYR1_050625, partial [Brachionus plicatilis]
YGFISHLRKISTPTKIAFWYKSELFCHKISHFEEFTLNDQIHNINEYYLSIIILNSVGIRFSVVD